MAAPPMNNTDLRTSIDATNGAAAQIATATAAEMKMPRHSIGNGYSRWLRNMSTQNPKSDAVNVAAAEPAAPSNGISARLSTALRITDAIVTAPATRVFLAM